MKLFPNLPTKEDVSNRLFNFPTLRAILSVLLFEPRFRWAFLAVSVVILSLPFIFLKIWTVTPANHLPKSRISLLDFAQAWSLRRTALKEAAAGKNEAALRAWLLAVGNNPGNPELVRGALSQMAREDDLRSRRTLLTRYAGWLFVLSQTNLHDLEFAVPLYEKFGLDDVLVSRIRPHVTRLPLEIQRAYLRALFRLGLYPAFATFWDDLQKRNGTIQDPQLTLYRAAYDAGWGEPTRSGDAKETLKKAQSDPAHAALAHNLNLQVSKHLGLLESYRASLEFLKASHLHTLVDEIGLWEMLISLGRKSDAADLIRVHVEPPSTGEETMLLSKVYFNLGMLEEARQLLVRFTPVFNETEGLWLIHATILSDMNKWEDLIKLALQIREEKNPLRNYLTGYSYYLEGLGELKLGRTMPAQRAFEHIPDHPFGNRLWGLITAGSLERLGYAEIAQKTLLQFKRDLPDSHEYWMLLSKTAFDLQDPDLLLSAMSSAHKLKPNDLLTSHNYAAALISTRQNPEEAVKLTLSVMSSAPQVPIYRLNHSMALLQNQRFTEARQFLNSIDARGLDASGRTSLALAWFEVFLHEQQYKRAAEMAGKVDSQFLFVTEKTWFEKEKRQLKLQANKE